MRHWIVDDVVSPELLRAVAAEWPDENWLHWHRYESRHALKMATRDRLRIPPAATSALDIMCSQPVGKLTGIDGLFPDFELYGGGMHALPPGGFLGRHLDCDHHPQRSWARRLSSVLFVNETWPEEWGGWLEIYRGETPLKSICPKFGRLVLLECTDDAWHAVTPVKCPDGESRKTLAVFYWQLGNVQHKRPSALFAGPVSEGS